MHRPASVGRLFGLIFIVAAGGILFSSRGALTDSLVRVTDLGSLGSNDSVAWSQLGADTTSLSSTINANLQHSNPITGTLAASGSVTSVVCPASQCSWGSPGKGGFTSGDTVIWTSDTANGGNGPLKIAFNSGVKGAGAMIQADGPAQFTAQIQAFNGTALIGAFTTNSDASGDAVFLGALDNTAAHITSVVYSLTSCTGACSDFAIDTLFINSASSGPTPTSTGTVVPTPTATATAAATATATATIVPTPVQTTTMLGAPSSINFGNVDASSSSKPHKVTVTNKGTVNAVVGSVTVPSGFSKAPGSDFCSNQTVFPKKSCTMMLQFSPTATGPESGLLSVAYNGGTATVSLSGNATPVFLRAPPSVVFAPVAAGTMGTPKIVSITNMSKTATVQIGGPPILSGPFSIASDMCSGVAVLPKGKCTIGLQFSAPQDSPSKSTVPGTLGISFTYGSNPGLAPTVSLMGRVR
jgi:hypothetical protein